MPSTSPSGRHLHAEVPLGRAWRPSCGDVRCARSVSEVERRDRQSWSALRGDGYTRARRFATAATETAREGSHPVTGASSRRWQSGNSKVETLWPLVPVAEVCTGVRLYRTLRSVVRFGPRERDRVERRLARAASVEDLRRIARRRLPSGVFDYIDGGAEDERTLAANQAAFAAVGFRPRVLRGIAKIDIASTILGQPLAYPLVLAPTGFTRIADPDGELAVARAAARMELPYTLSTLSTRSIEEVRAVSDGRLWFQVYAWRDRGLVREMVERTRAARYEALVLTVDTAVFGRRERDVRRGFALPPTIGPRTIVDGLLHPGWTWAFVRAEPIRFANVV